MYTCECNQACETKLSDSSVAIFCVLNGLFSKGGKWESYKLYK
jgi:hypothetical protein